MNAPGFLASVDEFLDVLHDSRSAWLSQPINQVTRGAIADVSPHHDAPALRARLRLDDDLHVLVERGEEGHQELDREAAELAVRDRRDLGLVATARLMSACAKPNQKGTALRRGPSSVLERGPTYCFGAVAGAVVLAGGLVFAGAVVRAGAFAREVSSFML